MSDREEIPDLLIRYATGIDRRDWSRGDDDWRVAHRRFSQVRVPPVGQPS